MDRERIKSGLYWAILASEASHIFCCVLPTLASVLSLLVGAGLISTMPGFILTLHGWVHNYEIPALVFAGVVLLLGWLFQLVSWRIDCHSTGCCHDSCAPRKKNALRILWIATALFVFNLTIYTTLHTGKPLAQEQADHAH